MQSLKLASAIISRFKEGNSLLPRSAWVEWRESLENILEGKLQIGSIHAAVNGGKQLATGKNSSSKIANVWNELNATEQQEVSQFIQLYRSFCEQESNPSRNAFSLAKFTSWSKEQGFELSLEEEIPQLVSEWKFKQRENKFKTILKVPATAAPIFWDAAIRTLILILWSNGLLSEGWYVSSMALFTGVTVVILALIRDKRISRNTTKLLAELNLKDTILRSKNSAWQYLFLVVSILLNLILLYHSFGNEANQSMLFALCIIGAIQLVYLMLVQQNLAKTLPSLDYLESQLKEQAHIELKDNLSAEENDEEIVNLEVNLKAENERMDAYVIEAALFGALAFSGFLQLVASENFSIETVTQCNSFINNYLFALLDTNGEFSSPPLISLLGDKNNLTVVLCYLALFCSIFFLAVIASRLRYSRLTDHIDRALQLSKAYNQKEEGLMIDNAQEAGKYTQLIVANLKEGYKMHAKVRPIMEYMEFFRTLGIVTFFVIIIFGGLYLSGALSFILALIAALSFGYFKLTNLKYQLKHAYIQLQEEYFRIGKWVHLTGWLVVLLATAFRTFHFPGGNILLVIGIGLLFIHYLLNLIIPAEFDYSIENRTETFSSGINKHQLFHVLQRLALATLFTGIAFKAMRWPGAGMLTIMGALLFVCYFLFGRKLKVDKPKWAGIILGIAIAVHLLTFVFYFMHWPGAPMLKYAGYIVSPIAVILAVKFWKNIRPFIQHSLFVFGALFILFQFAYLRYALTAFSFDPKGFQAQDAYRSLYLSSFRNDTLEQNSAIANFQDFVKHNPETRNDLVNLTAHLSLEAEKTNQVHEKLVIWMYEVLETPENTELHYFGTQAQLLIKLERSDEAKKIIQQAMDTYPDRFNTSEMDWEAKEIVQLAKQLGVECEYSAQSE